MFKAVSVDRLRACGLRPGGELVCWGDNTWGAAAAPPGEFAAVDVEGRLSCGLRPGGEAECWGEPFVGGAEPPPGPSAAIEVRDTWRGAYACGLRADGAAECWGPRWVDESPEDAFSEPDFDGPRWRGTYPGGTFSSVSSRSWLACGIRPAGTVECWGPDLHPGLGVPAPETSALAAERDQGGARPVGVPAELEWVRGDLPGGPYVELSSGWYHTCGVRADRTVECFGATGRSPEGEFTAIDVDASGVCGVRSGGGVSCRYLRWEGWADRVPDLPLAPGERVAALDSTADGLHVLLNTGDIVRVFGFEGRRTERIAGPYVLFSAGHGLVVHHWAPHPSEEAAHVCAVDVGGLLKCRGYNLSGRTALPAPWLDDPPYRAVAAGFAHTCAIGATGGVVCWGDDRHGQTDSPEGSFTELGAGQWHTCGLRDDGEVVCWGDGPADYEQHFDDPPPGEIGVPPRGPFSSLAVGQWHSCALRPDGTAAGWLSYGPQTWAMYASDMSAGDLLPGESEGCLECFEEDGEMEP